MELMRKGRLCLFRKPGAILVIFLVFMAQAVWAFAKDDAIHRIDSPRIFYDTRGGYSFIVFGDTRTANPDHWVAEHGCAFKTIRDWTHREVNKALFTEASFSLFTGDLLWRGGIKKCWQEVLELIPARFRSRNTYRFFPVLGNHELWQEPGEPDPLDLYFGAFPFLSENQVRFHNYYFTVRNSLFVNLCSGGYGTDHKADDRTWNCTAISSFDSLMGSLTERYAQMVNEGLKPRNIFVQYHKPSYSTFEHPPLDTDNDPLTTLMELKRKEPSLHVFIFNGHNHVTELFRPADGVYTLTAGGGGAPQKIDVPVRDWGKPMKERFWRVVGHPRNRRFNFFQIHVDSAGRVTVEEMCLYSYEDGAYLGYGPGVMMDANGNLFFGGNCRGNADGSAIIERIEKGF